MKYADRVDRVLSWLDRPAGERPRFLTLYFESVDSQGHSFGPDSPEVNVALADVDSALARLRDGLKTRGLDGTTDIIVVSDHGMARTVAERAIDIDKTVDPKSVNFAWLSRAYMGLDALPGQEKAVEKSLVGRHDHFECWRKEKIPARHAFGTHRRIPAFFCLADNGWILITSSRPDTYSLNGGTHGFDEIEPDMLGLFVANGPSFRRGLRIPAFDNVHVYPLMTKILGVTPSVPNDGDLGVLAPVLAP
jgi:predicted AlkP superfamily pyrophosphatase or phosphodiesterase